MSETRSSNPPGDVGDPSVDPQSTAMLDLAEARWALAQALAKGDAPRARQAAQAAYRVYAPRRAEFAEKVREMEVFLAGRRPPA